MTNIMVDAISLKLCQKGDAMSTQKSVKINEVNYPASSVVQSLERVNKELLKLIKKYEKMVHMCDMLASRKFIDVKLVNNDIES